MASTNTKSRKILKLSIITLKIPSLNEQLDVDQQILFKNTQIFYNLITEFQLVNTYVPFANLPLYLLLQTFIVFTSKDLISVLYIPCNITDFKHFFVALMQCVGNCQYIKSCSIFLPKAIVIHFWKPQGIWKLFRYVYNFFFHFCTIYRPEQNDIIKPFFLDFYSSGQDTILKFCTLTNKLKGYRSKKKFQDGSHYVYFTYQNTILRFWSVKYAILIIFHFFQSNLFVMYS